MQLRSSQLASGEPSFSADRDSSNASWLRRLGLQTIKRQIGYGYFVAIAMGWAGSMVGLLVADYHQGKGVAQLLEAQTQVRLLHDFGHTVDRVQLYSIRSAALSDGLDSHESDRFEDALANLQLHQTHLATIHQDIEAFLNQEPTWVADEPSRLRQLTENYRQLLQQQADAIAAPPSAASQGSTVFTLTASNSTAELERLREYLAQLIQIAQAQEATATNIMETAQGVEKLFIIVSMMIAAMVASLIAWRTTHAIAAPIATITRVVQRVANAADYSLRAPDAYNNDEMSLLAQGLNHLIERVASHTQSLEQAAQTAEIQNQELEATLETLKQAQTQLVQAEKMSSLGQLVAGIAHEINNPIGVIHGNLTYAQRYSETLLSVIDRLQAELVHISGDLTRYLEDVDITFIYEDFPKVLDSLKNGATRISNLVSSLKVFSRLQESHLKIVKLGDGINSALLLLDHRLKPQAKRPEIRVNRQYDCLPVIECYSSQMNQVFMNILNNAVDAIDERWRQSPQGWEPGIEIATETSKEHVLISIQNNGLPIPEAIQPKIFDPFFTTKSVGQGMGLGISISYEIVTKQHHGRLSFMSPAKKGIGAIFSIKIPRKQLPESALNSPNG